MLPDPKISTSLRPPMADRQVQRKMVLQDTPTLVLSTVETARQAISGHDEDDILCLIEEGFLLYAWNIGLSPEGRREIRIWPDSITWYARTMGKGQFDQAETAVLERMIDSAGGKLDAKTSPLKPGEKPFIRSKDLRLLFNCSGTHVIELILAKQLSVLPGTSWSTGPNGAALITVASITSFLKSRRLP